ncbi:unnamed protein product [Cylindrotheca closterium]|uniref:Uncharacterized protein n=1 Tax=Cylindrotheca closterium TaxID=2856 RepID=A0AAD2FRU4_9STRA|nr:unnamed protein product [Cylindrotheca closterium]
MKLYSFYFLLGVSWTTCVLGENIRGATRFTAPRSLQEANATIVDEVQFADTNTTTVEKPAVEVVAAKHHHDYSAKDFEYVSTRPSSKGSKKNGQAGGHSGKGGSGKGSSSSSKGMSGKGGKGARVSRSGGDSDGGSSGTAGNKKDSKTIITAQPTIMEAPTASPSQRPTAMNEHVFVLDNVMLFYIPSDGAVRLPTTLENAELLELTSSYIDFCFKNEYPDTSLTDLREVITDFAGINFIYEGEAIEKQFQPKVVFANSQEVPTRQQLQNTLHLIFDDDHIEYYMEWLRGPYPPPPDTAIGELGSGNIFKGAHVYNERPIIMGQSAGSTDSNFTMVMVAAAATGFTLFVAGVVISNRTRDRNGPTMEVKDLEKQAGDGTVTGETMTIGSGQTNEVSPLSNYMSRGVEHYNHEHRTPAQNDSLLLPSFGADRMTIDEESMEDVSISTDVSSRKDEGEETAPEAWSQDKAEMIDEEMNLEDDGSEISHEVINLEEVEDQLTAPEIAAPKNTADETELQERAHVDKQAVSDWRRHRGSEAEVIELLDVESFDSLEDPYSEGSSSSQTSESIQRPKSLRELTAMLSSRLPSERDMASKQHHQTDPVINEDSEKPKSVREMSKLFSRGSM